MEKEERRKKIMEKASGRMSFITNQFPNEASDGKSFVTNQFPNHDQNQNQNQNHPNQHLHSESPISKKEEEVDKRPSGEPLKKIESDSELVLLEKTSKAKERASVPPQTTRPRLRSFSPKRINACILSSENTRVVCSVMIALLVVFSNSNLPHHIIKERSIISRKPLYVMLLTDLSIVVGRIILAKRRRQKQAKKGKDGKSSEDVENWESAVKILEYGVVFYQMVRGVFIDCSFYMVIVTCGLSLV